MLFLSLFIALKQDLSLNLKLIDLTGWLIDFSGWLIDLSGWLIDLASWLIMIPSPGITSMCHCSWFFKSGFSGLNLGSHVGKGSTLYQPCELTSLRPYS